MRLCECGCKQPLPLDAKHGRRFISDTHAKRARRARERATMSGSKAVPSSGGPPPADAAGPPPRAIQPTDDYQSNASDPLDAYHAHTEEVAALMRAALYYARQAINDGYEVTILRDADRAVLHIRIPHENKDRVRPGMAIAKRSEEVRNLKASKGEFCGGGAPYGWQIGPDGVHLVPVADEQAVIGEAKRLRAGGLSLRAVAAELDRAGMRARNGRAFLSGQVDRMVAADDRPSLDDFVASRIGGAR